MWKTYGSSKKIAYNGGGFGFPYLMMLVASPCHLPVWWGIHGIHGQQFIHKCPYIHHHKMPKE